MGIDEVIYITGWLGDQVKPYVEANYPQFGAQFVVQEELVGQSHAIWLAREHISGPCFIVFADTISRIDLKAMARTRRGWRAGRVAGGRPAALWRCLHPARRHGGALRREADHVPSTSWPSWASTTCARAAT